MLIPHAVEKSAWFTLVVFLLFRLLWIASTVKCINNFGEGMKEVFKHERTIREFVGSHKAGAGNLFGSIVGAVARAVGAGGTSSELREEDSIEVRNQWLLSPEEEKRRKEQSQLRLAEEEEARARNSQNDNSYNKMRSSVNGAAAA